jgi:hypothetical protein
LTARHNNRCNVQGYEAEEHASIHNGPQHLGKYENVTSSRILFL